eukprot:gene31697-6901_t
MAHVLQAIGEELDLVKYDTWNVLVPEGDFLTRVGKDNFETVLTKIKGEGHPAIQEWRDLQGHPAIHEWRDLQVRLIR